MAEVATSIVTIDYTVPSKDDAIRVFEIRDYLATFVAGDPHQAKDDVEQLIRRGFVDLEAVDRERRKVPTQPDDEEDEDDWGL